MDIIKSIKKRLIKKKETYPVRLYPTAKPVGKVLFSYIENSILAKDNDVSFNGHSNIWESREIAKIFQNLGYIVDCINWSDYNFEIKEDYDILFDIHHNLQRLAPFLKKDALKILHITGSHPEYSIKKELERVDNLEQRKSVLYSPKRIVDSVYFNRSLKITDYCSLIGNIQTLSTFPEKYRNKITLVTVTASNLKCIKKRENFVSKNREFLWYFGSGAVHKGLDLLLDVFSQNSDIILNIVGDVKSEKDFWQIYEKELTSSPNIKYHGPLNPSSEEFIKLSKNIFCFIAPSCSEGISTAVATCMQAGFYPIISRDTGINLPENSGIYLENCTVDEIKQSVLKAYNLSKEDLIYQITQTQTFALKEFSRQKFSQDMSAFLKKIIKNKS